MMNSSSDAESKPDATQGLKNWVKVKIGGCGCSEEGRSGSACQIGFDV